MILADKIINERKKNGWSQEELAEMLSVSRQSVSKWESAQAAPDLNRIIKMAEIFGVSTDYLLKDDYEEYKEETSTTEDKENTNLRKVSLEEANRYLNVIKKNTPSAVIATVLLTLCPVALIELAGLSVFLDNFLPVTVATLIGLLTLFVCVAFGVIIWVFVEIKEKEFFYLNFDKFETLYGVDGMVKEKKKAFDTKRVPLQLFAILLFIFCPVGILITGLLDADPLLIISMVSLLLIMVAAGVGIFIYTIRINRSYCNLLKDEMLTPEQKKAKRIRSGLSGAYWCIVAATYLLLGLAFNLWHLAGVIFPVAGVIYAAALGIVKIFVDKD